MFLKDHDKIPVMVVVRKVGDEKAEKESLRNSEGLIITKEQGLVKAKKLKNWLGKYYLVIT